MLRDAVDAIIESTGPVVVKALAALAAIAVFVPLLLAFAAPLVG